MPAVEFKCYAMTVEIQTNVALHFWDKIFIAPLLALVQDLHDATPLQSFVVEPSLSPLEWNYKFTQQDEREWSQVLSVLPDKTLMNFACDKWGLEEFVPHRPLRDHVVEMIRSPQCLLQKVEVNWLL